jgi:ornithine carbamoyltransferase
MKKDLTKISDLSPADAERLLERAWSFKRKYDEKVRRENLLDGRVVAMVFEKASLRTKVSLEVATTYLGGTPIFLSSSQILASGGNQQGRESIPDIGRNLERLADLIVARVYSHTTIHQLATTVRVPVINALCDQHHPLQALADIMTVQWHRKTIRGVKVAFVGDGNNVATSLLQLCALLGVNCAIATPPEYQLPKGSLDFIKRWSEKHGSPFTVGTDPTEAVRNADCVYTDTFVSMGQESERAARLASFARYQVNAELMKLAKDDALFMHCLPAHRGEEVTNEVMDSKNSVVFDQAECRLHVAKAVLASYLGV